jgi:DNA-binding NtrC family response regulator
VRDEAERELLIRALTRSAGNITRAARDIDVSRPTLHDLLRKHGIDAARYRRPESSGESDEADGGAAETE